MLYGLALARESAAKKGPQEGVQDRRHSIGIKYSGNRLMKEEHPRSPPGPDAPAVANVCCCCLNVDACTVERCGSCRDAGIAGILKRGRRRARRLIGWTRE